MLVVQAGRFAREFGHSYVGTEHLLLAISEEAGGAGRVLRAVGMEEPCLRSMVLAGAGIGSRTLFLPQGLSPRARRAVHQAGVEAGRLHAPNVTPEHLLPSNRRFRVAFLERHGTHETARHGQSLPRHFRHGRAHLCRRHERIHEAAPNGRSCRYGQQRLPRYAGSLYP